MDHLSPETLSEYLDGGVAAGAEEHLSECPLCIAELEALKELRDKLRSLPELEAPASVWAGIEARLPVGGRFRRFRATGVKVAAAAAVFILGLGLGRVALVGDSAPGELADVTPPGAGAQLAVQPSALTVTEAMQNVQRSRQAYDDALRQLQSVTQRTGNPLPPIAAERLAALDVLVEASRAALSADPADPVLNSYLFAALEQRAEALREISSSNPSRESEVLWR